MDINKKSVFSFHIWGSVILLNLKEVECDYPIFFEKKFVRFCFKKNYYINDDNAEDESLVLFVV